MSHECINPDCPIHGNSPEAVRDRKNRQMLITNDEAMNAIRVIAANIHGNILENAGIEEGPFEMHVQMEILKGNADGDPVVEGLMRGMVVLLRDHYPSQQWVGLCAGVPENESIFKKKLGKDIHEIDGPIKVISSIDELFEILMGRRRP